MRTLCFIAATLLSFAMSSAHAEGDSALGKRQIIPCLACHTLDEGGVHKIGPNLHGIFGRPAGTMDGFKRYTDVLKSADIVWDEDAINAYIEQPAKFLPGNGMKFVGVKDPMRRANIIAYMKEATQ